MAIVQQAVPATVAKQSDGTYVVRIQHTAGGDISLIHFPNHFFAQELAEAYAAFLNGETTVKVDASEVAQKVKEALDEAKDEANTELRKILTEAKAEAVKLVNDAENEAEKIVGVAEAEAKKIKSKAEQLLKVANAAQTAVNVVEKVEEAVSPAVETETKS